jgi:hypothetical protein
MAAVQSGDSVGYMLAHAVDVWFLRRGHCSVLG